MSVYMGNKKESVLEHKLFELDYITLASAIIQLIVYQTVS